MIQFIYFNKDYDSAWEVLNSILIVTLKMWIYWEITDIKQKKNRNLIDASKEVKLEINVETTKYMLLSSHQNVGRNWDIKIANRSFGNVSQFKYLGTTKTNQNLIQEEIKRRLDSGNACYHSV
jgi:hypothetical protein